MEDMNTYQNINRRRGCKGVARILLCAAFLISHFSFLISLTSCSDDLIDKTSSEVDEYLLMRGYTEEQIKMQRLGYGYNAAGNVMDDSSFSAKPIINMNKVREAEKKYGIIVNTERRHYTSVDIFSGNTIQELGHEETKYTVNEFNLVGGGKYYRKNETTYKGKWTSSYKAHMFLKHIMATTTIDAGILRCMKLDSLESTESAFTEEFRKDLAQLVRGGESGVTEASASAFSEKYGTHIVLSSNLGGMCELQMSINRDSCVDKEYATQQVSEVILGKKVTKTTGSKVLKELPQHHIQYQGQISVKGGTAEDSKALHKTFDETREAEVKISDGDYYAWAEHISIDPNAYNAAFIGGRYLPLYQLFDDATTRRVLRKVYETYLKKEAPDQEVKEPDYGVLSVEGNYGPDVRVATLKGVKAAILCQEYVPSIRSDKPCVVAYPLIRDINDIARPFLASGLFVGDESHRPGRVIWEGSASVYIPNDSIFADSDSIPIKNLFDPKTKMLKNVYFYWNAVHPQPCPTIPKSPEPYTASVYDSQPATLVQQTTFAKVASTFWSVRPVQLDSIFVKKYWSEDKKFTAFAKARFKENYSGVLLTDSMKYNYCLVDGGDNYQRGSEFTSDNDGNKRWIDAVSKSVKALGLSGFLPSVIQSKSITKMLGNRMSVFYYPYYKDGRNVLGLDWPTGYWVISEPGQPIAITPEKCDTKGMPIITDDVGEARIMRLSGSGTDLLFDYPEYVRAFNYSDQAFFKFFPIYITINNFGK